MADDLVEQLHSPSALQMGPEELVRPANEVMLKKKENMTEGPPPEGPPVGQTEDN